MSDNLLQLYNEFIDQIKPENIQDAHITLWQYMLAYITEDKLIYMSKMSHYAKDPTDFLIGLFKSYAASDWI